MHQRFAAPFLIVATGLAQIPDSARPLPGPEPTLGVHGGEPWAFGRGCKTRFTATGPEFHVAAGPAAATTPTVRLAWAAIGRGDDLLPIGNGDRHVENARVEYRRPGGVECYDVVPGGIEQSFRLDSLPRGSGDLVVRQTVTTAMQVEPFGDGLRFSTPGLVHCTLGGVTAIDADGRRQAGVIRHRDGVIDYIVPADFVATARLPLLIDPLLGSATIVANASNAERKADLAFDATSGAWLMVYEFVFSATDIDIYGRRLDGAGVAMGSPLVLEGSGANDIDPQVANVNSRDRFVVVWNRQTASDSDVQARSVDAATGTQGPVLIVATGTDSQGRADIGGEATLVDQDAICVWDNQTQDTIEAAQLVVEANGALVVQDLTTIAAGSVGSPRISKSGGTTGRFLINWMVEFSLGDYDPYGMIVDRELNQLTGNVVFDGAVNFTGEVTNDGDGQNWAVAWKVKEAGITHDVAARSMHLGAGGPVLGSGIVPIETAAGVDERPTGVSWTGGSVVVASESVFNGAGSTNVRSIDPISCGDCEGSHRVLFQLTDDFHLAVASRRAAGADSDEALLVAEGRNTSTNLRARQWRSDDGSTRIEAPACGARGGVISTNCARAGNAGFAVRCQAASANSAAILVMSRQTALFGCGTCRLVPDPYAAFLHVTTTDAAGDAAFAVAIPPNISTSGIGFYLQWVVAQPVTPGCYALGSDLSAALRTIIQ
ncbi:MAG: hypothetical protein IPK26_04400 [Planctomycetes bacterium]|nr:hypothetical protein [Planctomycetota bacterium]